MIVAKNQFRRICNDSAFYKKKSNFQKHVIFAHKIDLLPETDLLLVFISIMNSCEILRVCQNHKDLIFNWFSVFAQSSRVHLSEWLNSLTKNMFSGEVTLFRYNSLFRPFLIYRRFYLLLLFTVYYSPEHASDELTIA